ncbi:A/G-specific adenine glycosylase [Blattabacterium sp. (Blattella germanica) str. Bge]|uniref:A/G-specific adenine glycosylase n=1 Tax=Blattabacterium sp. (Blattella germanica) TaxID=624186 RepID=UPI0001BB6257|nr:A/G-specific adenine glycosylase [Blattabacterium sp. (Blattella germanica)]ACY40545.1 A/G-specific adenine glycosylase [Blattabacterium sp. (Blattella germanica) str. Bge]
MDFSKKIINWYKKNHRKLPWRETQNPYYILVSEFILQQTRISKTTIKYYSNFIKKFPDLEKLAQAEEKNVLKEWEGLGYYSRARNLHSFAKELKKNNIFPKKYKELIKYKGIGPYTGAAIASICFNEVIPAVDGNAYRVFSRYLGIYDDITSTATKNMFRILILKMMDYKYPGIFNQAIMDIGSVLCTPKNAKCFLCPVKDSCFSIKNDTVYKFPVKRIKKSILKQRFFYYIFMYDHDRNICINKRSSQDIWKGLYDFPLIESEKNLSVDEIHDKIWKKFRIIYSNTIYKIKHKITHQILYIQFLNCEILRNFHFQKFFFVPHYEIGKYPFPSPIVLFLKHEKMI